jgi:hypothetical protein
MRQKKKGNMVIKQLEFNKDFFILIFVVNCACVLETIVDD